MVTVEDVVEDVAEDVVLPVVREVWIIQSLTASEPSEALRGKLSC